MTITKRTLVAYDPLAAEKLTGGMAVMDCGEWYHVVYAERDDSGHTCVSFAPGSNADGAVYAPGAEVWAHPSWQMMADLTLVLDESAGYSAADLGRMLAAAEREAESAKSSRDHWRQLAASTTQYSPAQIAAFSANAISYTAELELACARVTRLRTMLADPHSEVRTDV
jgi:hypothetical protein